MAYEIQLSEDAKRSFLKLEKSTAQRIYAKLNEIAASDPYLHAKRLTGLPFFSLRVGDYRVIMDIRRAALLIFVIKVGHRAKVYRD